MKRLLLSSALLAMVGCQTYEPRPVDSLAYSRAWAEQLVDVEPVHDYAAALQRFEPEVAKFDLADGIELREAEAIALFFNPQLRLARAQGNVPLATAREAGWWPDPQVQAQVMRFTDQGDESPLGIVNDDYVDEPWIVTAGINFTIPVSGRLAAEQDVRWSQYDGAWRDIVVHEWRLLTRLRDEWFTWSTARERVAVTRSYMDRLDIVAATADQIATAGEMQPTEARVLQIELARERARLIEFEAAERSHRLAALALMGLSPEAPVELHPTAFVTRIIIEPGDRRAALVENHPQVRAAEAGYEISEQQLRLEISMQYPDIQIGPGFNWEEGFWRVGLGIALPIPVWNHNRQGVARAQEVREVARQEVEVAIQAAVTSWALIETKLDYAAQQRAFLEEQVAPLVDQQVDESRKLLALGEINVLVLRDALASSLAAKLRILEVRLSEARAANQLAQMLTPRWVTPVIQREED